MTPWWTSVSDGGLAQGDYLPRCLAPLIPYDYGESSRATVESRVMDLVVLTQTCDLANSKVKHVVLCPARAVTNLITSDPNYAKRSSLKPVRRGQVTALHLLASPITPADNLAALYVDFRQIVSLPTGYLSRHAAALGDRWRLASPYVEHMSQAFARFFMRVGLPSDIPPYK